MQRRAFCCLICLLLALAPAAMAEGNFVMAGYDGEGSTHDWNTNGFFVRMQERTGLTFTFDQYTSLEKWQEAKDAMFAPGGELPDVLFKAALTTPELIRYSDSGQLIDLGPLLEENAPNLWALLEAHPDWREAITLPSGKIVALPAIQKLAPQNAMWINQTWLERLGLEAPTDWESLHEVLTAFRDRDPNGNGKRDEIPFAFLGPWELKFFSHAWGVAANDYNIYLDEAGQVHYWPAEESFWEMALALREFYQEGLLDPDGFITADALRRITDEDAEAVYGVFFAPTPVNLVPYDMSVDYALLEPLVFEEKQIYRDLCGEVTRGTFAITSACEDPAALLAWVDVLYTEEGAIAALAGTEGEDYVVGEDGSWTWKGGLEAMTASTLSELSVYDTGDMPWLFPDAFYDRYDEDNVQRVNGELRKLNACVVEPFPVYTLTEEESARALELQSQLGPYVDETLARVVLGELDADEAQTFVEGLEERGMQEMIDLWQSVAGRLGA